MNVQQMTYKMGNAGRRTNWPSMRWRELMPELAPQSPCQDGAAEFGLSLADARSGASWPLISGFATNFNQTSGAGQPQAPAADGLAKSARPRGRLGKDLLVTLEARAKQGIIQNAVSAYLHRHTMPPRVTFSFTLRLLSPAIPMTNPQIFTFVVSACLFSAYAQGADRDEIVLADFEGANYGDWQATGNAFDSGPADGTLPGQQVVSGFEGKGLVNTFLAGDKSTGTLLSPEFQIKRRFINLLVGGGRHPGETCVNLMIDGQTAATATGTATTGADDEHLSWRTWDVSKLTGKAARIEIVDRHTGDWGHINVDQIVESDVRREPEAADEVLALAIASLEGARHRAEADPQRPIFHVQPPALWNNDPNGPLFHNGYYHLFYQLNPYGDRWQHMHWGHVRSRDLAHWEHLPIALTPSHDRGEEHVFSGCAAVNGKGQVMLFYTSIGNRPPEQWAAVVADKDLVTWTKHAANPILTEKLHGDVKIHEWRDPFIFEHGDKRYMVCGGNLNANQGGQGVVTVYRAEDDELTTWKYLGILFQHPDKDVRNVECPLFFRLGDKWVLVVSQGQPVQYFVGELDDDTMTFRAEGRGVMDWGNYYAPNCLSDPMGRRIVWGWVNGFPGGRGWNGCLTLPRVLSLGSDGQLKQSPAPELAALRGKPTEIGEMSLNDTSRCIDGLRGDSLELVAEFEPGTAKTIGLRVRCSDDGKRSATIAFDGRQLDVAGKQAEFQLAPGEKTLTLHVFIDRSVVEVYANQRTCVTRVIEADPLDIGVEVFASGGTAKLRSLIAWPVNSIWK